MLEIKIKLKPKVIVTEELVNNLKNLNFIFTGFVQKQDDIFLIFYSQHQIERLLNITELQNYKINTFIEKHNINEEIYNKICFNFSFNKNELNFINDKLINYLKPKEEK